MGSIVWGGCGCDYRVTILIMEGEVINPGGNGKGERNKRGEEKVKTV